MRRVISLVTLVCAAAAVGTVGCYRNAGKSGSGTWNTTQTTGSDVQQQKPVQQKAVQQGAPSSGQPGSGGAGSYGGHGTSDATGNGAGGSGDGRVEGPPPVMNDVGDTWGSGSSTDTASDFRNPGAMGADGGKIAPEMSNKDGGH